MGWLSYIPCAVKSQVISSFLYTLRRLVLKGQYRHQVCVPLPAATPYLCILYLQGTATSIDVCTIKLLLSPLCRCVGIKSWVQKSRTKNGQERKHISSVYHPSLSKRILHQNLQPVLPKYYCSLHKAIRTTNGANDVLKRNISNNCPP